MNINVWRIMEVKKAGRSRSLIIMVLVGLALVTQGCVDEIETREYRNVNRELVLSDFEDALGKAGKNLEELMKSRAPELQSERALWYEEDQVNQQLKSILNPVLTQSTGLLKTYGISEAFLEQELGNPHDPRMVLIGLWIAEAERRGTQAQQIYQAQRADYSFFLQENTLTEDEPDWMECMLVAVGVDAIVEFVKGNVTEAIAKKAIRKIASRTLGWVGVALALYEYGNCMGWY